MHNQSSRIKLLLLSEGKMFLIVVKVDRDQGCTSIPFLFMGQLFLVTIMALVIPWSLTLAVVDIFSLFIKCAVRQPGILSIVVIGDWVLSFLALAASCSTASVTSILFAFGGSFCSQKICARYQFSAAMAFLSWFLILASSLFNLWLLPATL